MAGLSACRETGGSTLFSEMPPADTGVAFENTLPEESPDGMNIVQYLYYYNGAGVAAGDVNNDGLIDLYFNSNLGHNKLYFNRGNWQFEDVTEKSGVSGTGSWKTGVTMADVNADGWLDIYVCQVGRYKSFSGKNQLFINNRDGSFSERAAEFGLDLQAFCTQSAFFDYDLDGDLDCFVLCHSVHSSGSYRDTSLTRKYDPLAGDRLFRNDDGHFTDVTQAMGIYCGVAGYGLGLSVGDFNDDGYPDVYVGNDFHENDYLYLNQAGRSFRESITATLGHSSNFTMGCDMADVNNDAHPDLLTLDMRPESELVLKSSQPADPYDIYQFKHAQGYYWQLARNCLQLSVPQPDHKTFKAADIAYLAGVAATDWSWSGLMADFDQDGYKDIFISNGIVRRPNDLDYLKYISSSEVQHKATDLDLVKKMPSGAAANYVFRNQGNLRFENVSQSWGLSHKGCSNGALYTDLDNDGDQDLVTNNINEPASLFRNNSSGKHWLKVRFKGNAGNPFGIGAQLHVWAGESHQYLENQPIHGFLSATAPELLVGLDRFSSIDSLLVLWPDGSEQRFYQQPADQTLLLHQLEAKNKNESIFTNKPLFFKPFDLPIEIICPMPSAQQTVEEKLVPWLLDNQLLRMAVADVDGNGAADLYFSGDTPALFFQQNNRFVPGSITGLPAEAGSQALVLPNGLLDANTLPPLSGSLCCIRPADFDGDGDLDLFVGGGGEAGAYGIAGHSYLLENDGTGHYSNQNIKAPGLERIGMVADAQWLDVDGDRRLDLVICGPWMPIYVFKNTPAGFVKTKILFSQGLWNCLAVADLDGDGDQDLVAGNFGLNSPLHASKAEPLTLWIKDFDGNGSSDPVMTYFRQGKNYVFADKDWLLSQIPGLKKDFVQYRKYAESSFEDVFPKAQRQGAVLHKAVQLSSCWLENTGTGDLILHELPIEAQFSPVYAALPGDFDADGQVDLLLAGNFYAVYPAIGRQDAGYGLMLKGSGRGVFQAISPEASGFVLQGEIRDLRLLTLQDGRKIVLAAPNGGRVQVLEWLR
ncbi:MAG: CRTAC1 family protein [Lewinellaceae bacterium]|nr:CRTAC1 family protein [Lewinellaceae bacterium]